MPDFLLPDLGEGLTEGTIVTWLVAEGDTVRVDQPVVEVETAKAAVEVPVPFAGVVTRLHGEPGQSLPVGAPLLTIGPGFTEPGVTTASEGSGNVLIGYGTTTTTRRRRTRTVVATPEKPSKAPGVISPFVRKMAADNKIDLTKLTGSGPGGIIRRADVEAALAVPEQRDGETRIPLTGVRKAVADKLTTSRRQIPEATVWVDVDATGLVAARKSLNASAPDRPVSLLGLVARFAVAGLRKFPELNSRVEGDEIVQLRDINLGFAAQTDRGLVVPVVRDAGSLSTRELSAAIGDRTTQAREGKLGPAGLTGGTFTVNNYGVFGVDGSAAIINHPEAAILGIGRIIDRAWVVDGELVARKICELTLAFDHRVCDGGTAGGFLRFVADCVESPVTALGEL
ncbi:dihydrolipoamide acetyltransferase family protein [Amycolatopsis keratiniphila]|uniref:dihydrolipoamide acetyltransferase family protein n=1 Tax=Amycolatopsis keratiniphila TaxID=129921 RepID=UPI00087CA39E|nr:dihydrolipoamide acetyltransferase family protein [Amycolatopsis keratiniphila]OLZ61760.1 branched-chain alpha-keto acid dehydrogenase subunit E2 [Amycolatopsis keratiniphila subsp. nogabecina]SDU15925.1 pyruvate dehydrogenase E2 component (dihydrolipoamide acetyltransferase) [Amycolatopsis keratiniphila]